MRVNQISWIIYDWANSAWITVILTAFFPVLFREFWSSKDWATQGLAISAIVTQISVAILAPIVASIANSKGISSLIIAALAFSGGSLSCLLAFIPAGEEPEALLIFTLSTILYFISIALYDGLLLHVASPHETHRVSLLGYSLGYLGGGIALLLSLLLLKSDPSSFSLIFIGVGVWWAVFSLPILSIKQKIAVHQRISLRDSILFLLSQRKVLFFLIAYWLYIDGVNTIIRFGVDFGISINLPKESVLSALLLAQLIGFPATFMMLGLSRMVGPMITLLVCLAVYFFISLSAFFISEVWHFFALAAAISLVQGGTQALSRSIFANMIVLENSFVGFALFNIVTKFACIIGPLMMFLSAEFFGSNRLGVFAIGALFALGATFLWKSLKNQ